MVRFAHSNSVASSEDDDINTVPSRYTFDNGSTLSTVEDYSSHFAKLGGGTSLQARHDVVVTAAAAAVSSSTGSLITVQEGIETTAVREQETEALNTSTTTTESKNLFQKFGMFRESPTKTTTVVTSQQQQDQGIQTSLACIAGASCIAPGPEHERYRRSLSPRRRSPSREVRRYKNDGSRLEQQQEQQRLEEEKEASLAEETSFAETTSFATISLGMESSTGMYSAGQYSEFASSSKDAYSLEEGREHNSNSVASPASRVSGVSSSSNSNSQAPSSLQAEVDSQSKQASLDCQAVYTAMRQTDTPCSPVPPPSQFFQPVVRTSNNSVDDASDDVRTISPSMEIPSTEAENGSLLPDDHRGPLPPPLPTMTQRLFGGGVPAPILGSSNNSKSLIIKPSPTNTTSPTSSDDEEQNPRAPPSISTFDNIQEILRDPLSAPHEPTSEGEEENDEEKALQQQHPASLEGTNLELFLQSNVKDDDGDEHQSSITSITNAMERGRTMASQAASGLLLFGHRRQGEGSDRHVAKLANGTGDPSMIKEEDTKDERRDNANDGNDGFCLVWICLFLLLILGGVIAGVCGSGYCSQSRWQRPSSTSSPSLNESPAEDDILVDLPPDFFANSGSGPLFVPTPTPAGALGSPTAVSNLIPSQDVTSAPKASGVAEAPPSLVTIPKTAQPTGRFVAMPTVPVVIIPIWNPIGFQTAPPVTISSNGDGPTDPSRSIASTRELYDAVDKYLAGDQSRGPIGKWDVSVVTDFSQTFSAYRNPDAQWFNEDLSGWNTKNAVSMRQMFLAAKQFNGDVSSFDTSNVSDMQEMFARAEVFNGDLRNWDTSNVVNMRGTFRGAFEFNGEIKNWNTARVTDMTNLFLNGSSFNNNIGRWITSNVESMSGIFRSAASFNHDLNWDTSKVKDMDAMFMGASSFNGATPFDTSLVSSMNRMFYYAGSFVGTGVESWDTSRVTTMDRMFNGARSFQGDITKFDISNVRIAEKMLAGAHRFSRDLCGWRSAATEDPSLVSSADMFVASGCPRQEDPSPSNAFSTLCFACSGAPVAPVSSSSIMDAAHRGQSFVNTNELRAAVDAYLKDNSPTASVSLLYGYPIGNWRVERISDFSNLFSSNRNPDAVHFDESLENWDMTSASITTSMFEGAISFTGKGLSLWNTRSITQMSRMFAYSGFDADVSTWDVSSVRDFGRVFLFAHAFQSDLSNWDVSSAVDIGWMFRGALLFSSDLSKWDVRNVENFEKAFAGAKRFSSNLCSWNTRVRSDSLTSAMFAGSGCPDTSTPEVSSTWCWECRS